ncbi:MAG: hypothetical protein AB1758_28830, partial [Candidatus Eremiobacterota bacterium]
MDRVELQADEPRAWRPLALAALGLTALALAGCAGGVSEPPAVCVNIDQPQEAATCPSLTAELLRDSGGRVLAPGTSQSGVGAAVNESGQFVVVTNGGILVGNQHTGQGDYLRDGNGRPIAPGTSESGAGAAINGDGRFVAATNGGIVVG